MENPQIGIDYKTWNKKRHQLFDQARKNMEEFDVAMKSELRTSIPGPPLGTYLPEEIRETYQKDISEKPNTKTRSRTSFDTVQYGSIYQQTNTNSKMQSTADMGHLRHYMAPIQTTNSEQESSFTNNISHNGSGFVSGSVSGSDLYKVSEPSKSSSDNVQSAETNAYYLFCKKLGKSNYYTVSQ